MRRSESAATGWLAIAALVTWWDLFMDESLSDGFGNARLLVTIPTTAALVLHLFDVFERLPWPLNRLDPIDRIGALLTPKGRKTHGNLTVS